MVQNHIFRTIDIPILNVVDSAFQLQASCWLHHTYLVHARLYVQKMPVFLALVRLWLPVSAFPVRLTFVVVHVQGEVLLDHV